MIALCPSDVLFKILEDLEFIEILLYRSVCRHWRFTLNHYQPKCLNFEKFSCSVESIFAWSKRMKKRNRFVFQRLECLNISFPFLNRHHVPQFCYYFKNIKSLTTLIAFSHPYMRFDYNTPMFYIRDHLPQVKYVYSNIYPTLELEKNMVEAASFHELAFGKLSNMNNHSLTLDISDVNKSLHQSYCSRRIRHLYILGAVATPYNFESVTKEALLIKELEKNYEIINPNHSFDTGMKKTSLFLEICEVSKSLRMLLENDLSLILLNLYIILIFTSSSSS
jgi:hypothetical protein